MLKKTRRLSTTFLSIMILSLTSSLYQIEYDHGCLNGVKQLTANLPHHTENACVNSLLGIVDIGKIDMLECHYKRLL